MRGIQIAALSSLTYAQGFVFRASKSKPRFEQTSLFDGQSSGVQLVSLEGLGDDHETVGESMATSLASWLDDEWIPQDVHMKMGNRAKETYVRCRTNGIDDVAEIMTEITDDLYRGWDEFNADAFVNAWVSF
ncbi:hypothetical protein THAOC_26429 [Thalassiosira oceanica]|uniref:Uncharacterized protein n=1 Tax=Thalassiosira oceanica TaxID=159749 RepID=K0RLF2_THAOC|nr:hypothetical protein THAOC_26429 [Thalassiosira oceanica]|eukprot:EJK54020.1 hypothetical protein THAOC_26429 [Thalassiosira oceanica]